MMANRTHGGSVNAQTRRENAVGPHNSFPIFDARSADAALHLRGRAENAAEREAIIKAAHQYDPAAADRAQAADKKAGKV